MDKKEMIITTAIAIFKELVGTMDFPRNLEGFKKAVSVAVDIVNSVACDSETSTGN
jgi:hypothetical protein